MVWFKVDDGFHHHPKVLKIPRSKRCAALGLWTLLGNWSADQLTDGHIPSYMLAEMGGNQQMADALVKAELWEITEGGWYFHDWADHQPTRAKVLERRDYEREKKRNQRRGDDGKYQQATMHVPPPPAVSCLWFPSSHPGARPPLHRPTHEEQKE